MALTYSCDAPAQPIRKHDAIHSRKFHLKPETETAPSGVEAKDTKKRLFQGGATGSLQQRLASCLQIT